jgi:uncharacterized membrane protein HdeD (DUF308 family)
MAGIELETRIDDDDRHHLGTWIVLVGGALALLGLAALAASAAATLVAMVTIGLALAGAGAVQSLLAFRARRSGPLLLGLLGGVLSVVVGALVLARPTMAAEALTLLLVAYFLVFGAHRIVAALLRPHEGSLGAVAGGALSIVLGLLLWAEWPASGLWFMGVLLGLNLLADGVVWIALGLALRRPLTGAAPRPA